MTQAKLRIFVSGQLILCLLSLFWKDYGEHVIGLTDLVAASGAWVSFVWLLPRNAGNIFQNCWRLGLCAVAAWWKSFAETTLITRSPAHWLILLSPLMWGTALYWGKKYGLMRWDVNTALIILFAVLPLLWLIYSCCRALSHAFKAVREVVRTNKVARRISEMR